MIQYGKTYRNHRNNPLVTKTFSPIQPAARRWRCRAPRAPHGSQPRGTAEPPGTPNPPGPAGRPAAPAPSPSARGWRSRGPGQASGGETQAAERGCSPGPERRAGGRGALTFACVVFAGCAALPAAAAGSPSAPLAAVPQRSMAPPLSPAGAGNGSGARIRSGGLSAAELPRPTPARAAPAARLGWTRLGWTRLGCAPLRSPQRSPLRQARRLPCGRGVGSPPRLASRPPAGGGLRGERRQRAGLEPGAGAEAAQPRSGRGTFGPSLGGNSGPAPREPGGGPPEPNRRRSGLAGGFGQQPRWAGGSSCRRRGGTSWRLEDLQPAARVVEQRTPQHSRGRGTAGPLEGDTWKATPTGLDQAGESSC